MPEQVLPDTTTSLPVVGDERRLGDKQACRTAFAEWCSSTRSEEKVEEGKAPEEADRLTRLSNIHWLAGLDHALKAGCGLTLASFLPLRRVVPLESGQE